MTEKRFDRTIHTREVVYKQFRNYTLDEVIAFIQIHGDPNTWHELKATDGARYSYVCYPRHTRSNRT